MSRADVARLLGAPAWTNETRNGATWYYEEGRIITFDARGRVLSAGFPPP